MFRRAFRSKVRLRNDGPEFYFRFETVFFAAGGALAALAEDFCLRDADFAGCTFPGRAFGELELLLDIGNLSLTARTAFAAALVVPEDTRVLPWAARLPMMVPAIAPATAPTGPAITPPTMAPATPPAVCFETGRLLETLGEELFFFMPPNRPRIRRRL